ncbi:MAG: hypothetical protein AAGM38_18315 [Pseudomonadota bacterium]
MTQAVRVHILAETGAVACAAPARLHAADGLSSPLHEMTVRARLDQRSEGRRDLHDRPILLRLPAARRVQVNEVVLQIALRARQVADRFRSRAGGDHQQAKADHML